MATRFYPIRVKDIAKTTSDCSVIEFDIQDEQKVDFVYKQGQYLTLKANINGEEVRRSYSLCSSPLEAEWKVAIKQIPDGRFSTFANEQLQVGDTLDVMPPNGKFFVECAPTATKNYVAFAAGSGITPILSIIKTHLESEPNSTFKLFYVNRAVGSIILKEEVEALKNIYFNRFELFHFLTQEHRSAPLFNGRITEEKLATIFKHIVDANEVNDYFICGPEAMIFMIRDFLQAKGVNPKSIHFELFGTSTPQKQIKRKVAANASNCAVTILEGDKSFNFNLLQGSDNILDAALKQNADLPFACKGGVCCTCRAKLVEGSVDLLVNYALEQEELDAGYILTCQAIPTSEKVIVDFDA